MITFHTLSNDVVVHQHTAEENAVNAYLIETPEEVVAIDATFLLSDARDLRATLDEIESHSPAYSSRTHTQIM